MTFEEVSLSSFLVPSFPTLWFATHSAGSHIVFKWRCKDRQKGIAHGQKSLLLPGWGMKRNEKEWKRKESRKIRGVNSDEFVFFSFYRRKHRFSAQIFYLIEENERKNGEIVRKIGNFWRNFVEYIRLQQSKRKIIGSSHCLLPCSNYFSRSYIIHIHSESSTENFWKIYHS